MAGKRFTSSVLGGTRRLLPLLLVVALFSGLLLAVQPAAAIEAAQTCQAQHVVRAGETLASIGRQYGVSWTAIAQANNLANANQIYAGQRLCIPGGSSTPPPAPATGKVSGVYYLNVRSGPGMSYDRITVISNGTQVTLLGRDNYGGWLKVRLANGTEGWVGASYITTSVVISTLPVLQTNVPPPPAGGATGVVATYGLNMRTGPGTNYPVVLALSQGMTVPVSHRNSEATWVRVTLPGGTVGWVSAPYLTLSTAVVNLPVWQ